MPEVKKEQVALQKKKVKKKSVIGMIVFLVFGCWGLLYILPFSKSTIHPYFDQDNPLVIAHQGGEHLAPSNTLASFEQAMELGVDVIEFDIHMTKDGHLVSIHDDTVDRTTNGSGKVNDLTLKEVQSLDAGTYFKDLNGEYSYKDEGVFIPTVEQIFEAIPNMRWNIEIKDTNDPVLYKEISIKLWETIKNYQLEDQVLIVSFDQDIIDIVTKISNDKALVSGGRGEITKFVILHKLFLNGLYQPKVDAFQIPIKEGIINLADRKLIRGASKRGIDIHYWTINDEETMKRLIDLGATGIITDRPDIMLNLLGR